METAKSLKRTSGQRASRCLNWNDAESYCGKHLRSDARAIEKEVEEERDRERGRQPQFVKCTGATTKLTLPAGHRSISMNSDELQKAKPVLCLGGFV